MVNGVRFLISKEENLASGPETRLDRSELLCRRVLSQCKRDRESVWHRHQKWAESESALLASYQGLIYFFSWLLKIERSYQTHSHNLHLKIKGLELTTEKSYQKRIIRRFLLRMRNMSLSKIHCCYIIISTEFKEKHSLEQHELFCFIIISSGLKENKGLCTKTKECRKKSLSLSPPREPWTPSSLWALDSISTYLRINSLTYAHISQTLKILQWTIYSANQQKLKKKQKN